MKKYTVAIAALLLISMISAFEDKPALGRAERAALMTAKGIGAATGGIAGSFAGGEVGEGAVSRIAPRPDGSTLYPKGVRYDDKAALLKCEVADMFISGPAIYAGLAGGTVGGYKGGKSLAILALAKLHGVPYRVEALSQHYNINVSQYKPILVAAASQSPESLTQAINEVYTQRFGEDWQATMQKLFKKYRRRGRVLVKDSSFIRKGNLRDFVRMVELGAAMANLYFKTNPNKEYTINSAIELYQELGLLN